MTSSDSSSQDAAGVVERSLHQDIPATRWRVVELTGPAAALAGKWPPEDRLDVATIALCRVQGPLTVLLGRNQPWPLRELVREPPEAHDRALPLLTVARRISGGGAVVVGRGSQVWINLWVPANSPRWQSDILKAGLWIGSAWASGLSEVLGGPGWLSEEVSVHRGRLEQGRWSDRICFSSLGPAEVTVRGKKLVGIAQRRIRQGALFHCVAPASWVPEEQADVLWRAGVVSDAQRLEVCSVLERATGLSQVAQAEDCVDALPASVEKAVLSRLVLA